MECSKANDRQKFPERIDDVNQNRTQYHRLEFYESDEDDEKDEQLAHHEKSWNILDGMTSAINTQKSENESDIDGFTSNKL